MKKLGLAGVKFTLPQLAQHRGKTVDAVIVESVAGALAHSSYNCSREIMHALERVGLPAQFVDPVFEELGLPRSN